jgi:hypothetical protein
VARFNSSLWFYPPARDSRAAAIQSDRSDTRAPSESGAYSSSPLDSDLRLRTLSEYKAYTWASQNVAIGATDTPAARYSYNSSGRPIEITHTALGAYVVSVHGRGQLDRLAGGNVQITAFNSVALRSCQSAGWTVLGAPAPDDRKSEISIVCHDEKGLLTDFRFSVSFTEFRRAYVKTTRPPRAGTCVTVRLLGCSARALPETLNS